MRLVFQKSSSIFFGYRQTSLPLNATSQHYFSSSSTVSRVSALRDGVFKSLFADKNDSSKIISFLEAMDPDHEPNPIEKVEFQDPYFPAYSPGEKDIYVDLICKVWYKNSEPPKIYVVEMQRVEQDGYVKRWEFYASRCYTNELLKAKTYNQLVKTHVIALMCHPCKYPSDYYRLTGLSSGKTIEESRVISLVSLDELGADLASTDSMKKKWLHLIKFSGTAQLNTEVLQKEPIFSKALNDLSIIEASGQVVKKMSRVSKGVPWRLMQQKIKHQVSEKTK